MELPKKSTSRKSAVKPQPDRIAEMLPNLADFLQYGEITVGIHPWLGYVATAAH